MSFRARTYSRSRRFVRPTHSSFCGCEFDRDESRPDHLADHDPEDAGLNPLGELNDDHGAPLFEEVTGRVE
ncbi:hypothetical protein [Halobacterium sp. R2-5]|uniref:hypothetical protein n=1 Tax=Halobacterium sp. R2-5 TaxID=2715751 RepID=UPI00141F9683|nr:hypothetical protein [Halobacterium sp. R2-5]NIC00076.1 hypothetical protein [Halobacterium sp. R2-5]